MGGWLRTAKAAGRSFREDNAPMLASALAYSAFFAIPSTLLVVVGVFTLTAGPGTITSLIHHLDSVLPSQVTSLLDSSLTRLHAHRAQSAIATAVGAVLALWSTTSAMTSYMTAINLAYGRKDSRGFVRKRAVALAMVAIVGVAFLLVAVLLMFGPPLEHLAASHAGSASGAIAWLWWIGQWPILVGGLVVAFATMLHLGPDDERRLRLVTPGAVVSAVLWLAASGAFAFYSATFASYDKTWGSLSAVIVMLTWLWLSSMALLFGAEFDAQAELVRVEGADGRQPAPLHRHVAPPRRHADRLAGR